MFWRWFWRSLAVQRRILRSPGVFSARATLQRGLSKGEESRAFCFCETSEMKTLIFMFLKVYSLFFEKSVFWFLKNTLHSSGQGVSCAVFHTLQTVLLFWGCVFKSFIYRFNPRSTQTIKSLGKMRLYPTGKSKSSRQSSQSWIGVDRREPVRLLRASDGPGIANLRLDFTDHRWI